MRVSRRNASECYSEVLASLIAQRNALLVAPDSAKRLGLETVVQMMRLPWLVALGGWQMLMAHFFTDCLRAAEDAHPDAVVGQVFAEGGQDKQRLCPVRANSVSSYESAKNHSQHLEILYSE